VTFVPTDAVLTCGAWFFAMIEKSSARDNSRASHNCEARGCPSLCLRAEAHRTCR
jgi:hypothetical protein